MLTSTQNPKIKWLQTLQQKSSQRRKEGLFVVEGQRELMHCKSAGMQIDTLFYCRSIMMSGNTETLHRSNSDVDAEWLLNNCRECIEVAPQLYERLAYRGGTEGIIGVVKEQRLTLSDLRLTEKPLLVVLESVEKPGNLGAVLRSADASGADAIIVCDPRTDLYNPNLIRSSLGSIFSVPCVACESAECIAFLKERDIRILTAQLQDSELYYDSDMTSSTAIVMGTEATGLTPQWREAADAHIRIPMLGQLDSLNVSVSAAILLFEAVRQRHTKGSIS
ncbi:MAG: RNA methyltransferase [Bacteroidales bacterium]|nr:RNA methyltransferase [Candidatus Physcousia equi]